MLAYILSIAFVTDLGVSGVIGVNGRNLIEFP